LVPEREVVLEWLNFSGGEEEDGEDGLKAEQIGEAEEVGEVEKKENELNPFKYLRCLAAFYIRLAWDPVDIYTTLEPLLTDYRKIRRRLKDTFTLTHVDQFVDDLLTKDRLCATSLWKLPSRANLEDLDMLEPRESPLEGEVEELDEEGERDGSVRSMRSGSEGSEGGRSYRSRSYDSRSRSRSRSYDSRERRRTRSPSDRSRRGSRSRSRTRTRSRSRNRGRDQSDGGR
jgi:pre-mRNA-splicing factor 38A